jgi:hypothetical protein
MFGFPAVSSSGGAIERLIEMCMAGETPPGAAMEPAALLEQLVDGTKRLVQEIETARQCKPSRGMLATSRGVRRAAAPMVRVRPYM